MERWCLGGALGGWLGRGWGEGTQRPDTHMACYSRTLQSSSIPRVGIFTETLYNQEIEVLDFLLFWHRKVFYTSLFWKWKFSVKCTKICEAFRCLCLVLPKLLRSVWTKQSLPLLRSQNIFLWHWYSASFPATGATMAVAAWHTFYRILFSNPRWWKTFNKRRKKKESFK